MPQWAGSCWYELRYLDPTNAERFVDPEIERYWMGSREPWGMVQAYAYKNARGSYVEASEVVERDGRYFFPR